MADDAFALSPINARAALPTDTDYDAICDAFMETSRGRWFLREYSKRNRNADTQMVLQAVARIEEHIARQKQEDTAPPAAPEPPVDILPAVQSAILEARQHIMQSVVADDDKPALDVIKAGMDTIRNVAWALRERGVDLQICGIFDHQVSLMMDGYLQLSASQTARETTPAHVLAAFDWLLERVAGIAAGEPAGFAQEPAEPSPVEAAPDIHQPAEAEPPAAETFAAPADEPDVAEVAAGELPVDADTAFREIYGDEHDIEIIESPVQEQAQGQDTVAVAFDDSADDDFIQAITDTAQELARLETLDTVVATSQMASAPVETIVPPEPEIEPEPFAEPVRQHAMDAPPVAAPVMAEPAAAPPTATPLPDVTLGNGQADQPDAASGTSLGHAVLRNGLLRSNGTRPDPMAVFNRMSQAEKIAFVT